MAAGSKMDGAVAAMVGAYAGLSGLRRRIARRSRITYNVHSAPCPTCMEIARGDITEPENKVKLGELTAAAKRTFYAVDVGTTDAGYRCSVCRTMLPRAKHGPPAKQPYELIPILRRESPVRRHLCAVEGKPCPSSGRCDRYGWVYVPHAFAPGELPRSAKIERDKSGNVRIVMPKPKGGQKPEEIAQLEGGVVEIKSKRVRLDAHAHEGAVKSDKSDLPKFGNEACKLFVPAEHTHDENGFCASRLPPAPPMKEAKG